jgi:two-component system alkaline phosphatase synthesis response regulator PhoP
VSEILIVEDEPDIAELVAHTLQRAGYGTVVVPTGPEALARARTAPPALVILDLMLPGLDGLAVCQALRADARTAAVPILILTARTDESDRVAGLELGADDYVTKPFSPRELAARVAALLRRVERAGPPGRPLVYGPIRIDLDRHVVTVAGRAVALTAKEFLLLRYFVERPGRVLSRDRLLTDVWGYRYTGGTRTVDVHVRRLREKIPLLARAIETVKQFGYKLAEQPPEADRPA